MIRIYGLKIFLSTKGYLNEFLLWLGVIDTPIRIMFTPSAVIIGFGVHPAAVYGDAALLQH